LRGALGALAGIGTEERERLQPTAAQAANVCSGGQACGSAALRSAKLPQIAALWRVWFMFLLL
jgi:hypothetical protein